MYDAGAAQHITPHAFHEALSSAHDDTVLIDVRNMYETRVGKRRWDAHDALTIA